jgi:hypothetical protein
VLKTLSPPEAAGQTSQRWANDLELAQQHHEKQPASRPKVAEAVAAIERCPTVYYVIVDVDRHRPLAVAPPSSAAQAACHAPLAKVLDDC